MEQRSAEWYQTRLGKVTASRIADLMARTKSGYSTSRANYMAELIAERLTGAKGDSYQSSAMQWGTEQEPYARAAYETLKGVLVSEIGFVPHPTIPNSGASPDGLVDDDGLVEIKCPFTATHLEFLTTGIVPERYNLQMQWQMACTGRGWCDYVSYDPRLPERMSISIQRVNRDFTLVGNVETEVRAFLSELDAKILTLIKMFPEENQNG
jgi:putative phage-type endonuclease